MDKPPTPDTADDPVNAPAHYRAHPSGVECIDITEHMQFNLGNAVKYIWRADLKGNAVQDLQKAAYYIDREIALRTRAADSMFVAPSRPAPAPFTPLPQPPEPSRLSVAAWAVAALLVLGGAFVITVAV